MNLASTWAHRSAQGPAAGRLRQRGSATLCSAALLASLHGAPWAQPDTPPTPTPPPAAASGVAPPPPAAAPPQDAAALRARLQQRIAQDRSGLCLQVALVQPSGVLREAACAGTRPGPAPAADAAFEIGSVSKTMLAFLVADLVAQGRWSLDDPLARHLPVGTVVPRQGERQILLRDVLTHRAGLPRLPPNFRPGNPADPYADVNAEQLLAGLAQTRLINAIGSSSVYSNYGYLLLSLAVSLAYEGDLGQALATRLWQPLGMASAHLGAAASANPASSSNPASAALDTSTQVSSNTPVMAPGHQPGGRLASGWTIAPALAGVGMVRATLNDMVRYAQAHLGLLPTPLTALLQTTQQALVPGAAWAWSMPQVNGRTLVQHGGATGGYSSLLVLDPTRQRAVVLLIDTEQPAPLNDLAYHLLGLDARLRPPRVAQPISPQLLADAPGRYKLGQLNLRVWRQGDGLVAQADGQAEVALGMDNYGHLYPQGVNAHAQPIYDGAAMVGFLWTQNGPPVEAWREGHVPRYTAQNPAWRDWAGEYAVAPGFSIRIFERDGQLMLQGSGQPALVATVTAPDRVEVPRFGVVLLFNRDVLGQVHGATLQQNGQNLSGPKRDPAAGGANTLREP